MPRSRNNGSSLDIPDTRDVYRHRARQITAHAPTPYGSIPTRRLSRKQKQKHHESSDHHPKPPGKRASAQQAPYPYFENAADDDSTFLASLFTRVLSHFSEAPWADVNKEPSSPVGFMPRSPPPTTPLDVSVPITISRTTSERNDDAYSYLSTSSSSCGSLSSSTSSTSSSSNSSLATIGENTPVPSSPPHPPASSCVSSSTSLPPPSTSNTTLALSDLLCDHYVQERSTATINTEEEEIHDVENKGVPLETFRIFEAPSPDDDERWFAWTSPTDWTPILDDDDEDDDLLSTATESSLAMATADTRDRDSAKADAAAAAKCAAKSPSSVCAPGKKKAYKRRNAPKHQHARDIRVNSAHLRMIVAEANMMRAQKIIGPLRPRGYLPKRLDPFTARRPSSLRYQV